jgi:hypothetical protein
LLHWTASHFEYRNEILLLEWWKIWRKEYKIFHTEMSMYSQLVEYVIINYLIRIYYCSIDKPYTSSKCQYLISTAHSKTWERSLSTWSSYVDEADLIAVTRCLLPLYPPHEPHVAFSNSSLSTMHSNASGRRFVEYHPQYAPSVKVTQQSSVVTLSYSPVVSKREDKFCSFRRFLAME